MQLSHKPTDTIIIKAKSNSNTHSINFALIGLAYADKLFLIQQHEDASLQALMNSDFLYSAFRGDAIIYFWTDSIELPTGKNWSYIEITQDEIEALEPNSPNCEFENGVLKFYDSGAQYTVHSEEEQDEFWTEVFNPNELKVED